MEYVDEDDFWFLGEAKRTRRKIQHYQNMLDRFLVKNRKRKYVTISYQNYGGRPYPISRSRFSDLKKAQVWCAKVKLNVAAPANRSKYTRIDPKQATHTVIFVWDEANCVYERVKE